MRRNAPRLWWICGLLTLQIHQSLGAVGGGYKFLVNDGSGELTIFVSTQPGIDLAPLAVGKTVKITGFSSQFDTHYEIVPRFPSDIAILAS